MRYPEASIFGPGSLTGQIYLMLLSSDPDSFPKIGNLLGLAWNLPATSAKAECSFSVLRLIKGFMADTRFSALILMKIHYS